MLTQRFRGSGEKTELIQPQSVLYNKVNKTGKLGKSMKRHIGTKLIL